MEIHTLPFLGREYRGVRYINIVTQDFFVLQEASSFRIETFKKFPGDILAILSHDRFFKGSTLGSTLDACTWKINTWHHVVVSVLFYQWVFSTCARCPCYMHWGNSSGFAKHSGHDPSKEFHVWFDGPQNPFLLFNALSQITHSLQCNL